MRILVFDTKLSGHHLEYLHHLYMMAVDHPEDEFIFVVPKSFGDVKGRLYWPFAGNIQYDYINKESSLQDGVGLIRQLRKSIYEAHLLNKYALKHHANNVFAINLMSLVPFGLLFFSKGYAISGIIYQIYLYKYDEMRLLKKLIERLKYSIITKCGCFKTVFILNDSRSAKELNSIYKTNKFKYLVDPYMPITPSGKHIRSLYGIDSAQRLLIHIGSMEKRKGTMLILDSLRLLTPEEKKKLVFFFAGRVSDEIKTPFYDAVKDCNDVRIIVKDEYCGFDFFADLCSEADAVLMPYLTSSMSSGIIGYASQFMTPVISTSHGLIGNLVRQYKLGLLLDDTDTDSLLRAYKRILSNDYGASSDCYCETHTIEAFNMTIYNSFK